VSAPEDAASADDLSAVAHALRTPLAVITGYAELLQARDDERTRREAADRIAEAAARLSSEIDQVLNLLEQERSA
jgi:signal transduction histidine kinase